MKKNIILNDRARTQISFFSGLVLQFFILLIMSKFGLQNPPDLSQSLRVVIQNVNNIDIIKEGDKSYFDKNAPAEKDNKKDEINENNILQANNETEHSVKDELKKNQILNPKKQEVKQNPQTNKNNVAEKNKLVNEQEIPPPTELENLMAKLQSSARKVNSDVSNRPDKYQINVFNESRDLKISETIRTEYKNGITTHPEKFFSGNPGSGDNQNKNPETNSNILNEGKDNSKDDFSGYTIKGTVGKPKFDSNPGSGTGTNYFSYNNSSSGDQGKSETNMRAPGILSSPDLDARHLLNKGEYHYIRFQGKIDANGFIKEIYIVKAAEFLKLNNLAKQHIISNWRWAPGFDNAIVTIDLKVERK